MYCENCGAELQDPNQPSCPNCGIPLKYQIFIESLRKLFNVDAGAIIKDKQIIYSTDNWDISGDVDKIISSWVSQNAQFIMVSEVKYSILQMEPERLVAISLKGEESIVATKDNDYVIILRWNSLIPNYFNFNPSILISVEKKIRSLMNKESISELTIDRQYIPEIFNADALEISKDDGLPILKPFVIKFLLSRGIFTEIFGNIIRLEKTKPPKDQPDGDVRRAIMDVQRAVSNISTQGPYLDANAQVGTTASAGTPIPVRVDPQLKGEIQSFLDWIKDREGLAGYINYYLQQNNHQVISELSRIYNELKQIFRLQKIEKQKVEKIVKKSKDSDGVLRRIRIDPETTVSEVEKCIALVEDRIYSDPNYINAVSDMIRSDPNIIAAVILKGTQIIYRKGNWDSGDIDRLLSSWDMLNAQFIMISGLKYSILQVEPERLVAISLKGEGSIIAAKDGEYKIICIYKDKNKKGNLPFPYIFNPPDPPRDLGILAEPQLKRPISEQSENISYCKHCGAELPEGQTICHVCGKKVI